MAGGGRSSDLFHEIISLENLFLAWKEFRFGKRRKNDVAMFETHLEDNLFSLHKSLSNETYKPSKYSSFYVYDPKLRNIHKAQVLDRVVYQAVFRILYKVFDSKFIFDSYSSRLGKGTHRGVLRLRHFARKISRNYTRPVFVLKCDVRKFFDSIDHEILENLIYKNLNGDKSAEKLVKDILESFEKDLRKGLPLGNVTSQLFANVYLDELDKFIKHFLREKYYIRYCDDFVILHTNKDHLLNVVGDIESFLSTHLQSFLIH